MKFSSMVAARAELFEMIRRKPMKVIISINKGYDITMLVTNDIL